MELLTCPPHASLREQFAKIILERHSEQLPDLSPLIILSPDGASQSAIRSALGQHADTLGYRGLILPEIHRLQSWVCHTHDLDLIENNLSEMLDLVVKLSQKDSHALAPLTQANPWGIATDMFTLFGQLWLNDISLPSNRQELEEWYQRIYEKQQQGAPDEVAPALSYLKAEAGIVHTLWQVWDKTSGKTVSSGKYYREALDRLPAMAKAQAIYVCGYEHLAHTEIMALEQVSDTLPVCILARSNHFIPFPSEQALQCPPPSPEAAFLTQAFATEEGIITNRAQAYQAQYPQSPLLGNLRLLAAEQSECHAHAIDIQIRDWLNQGRRNIGLITEDRKLARRVNALLQRSQITMQDFSGWALSTTSAASLIERWIECVAQDFHYLLLLDILKSPFVVLPGLFEELSQQKLVIGFERGISDRNACHSMARYRHVCQDQPELLRMLECIEKAAEPLQKLKSKSTGSEYFNALMNSLDLLGSKECLLADEAGEKILNEFGRLEFELRDSDEILPIRYWLSLFRNRMEKCNYHPRAEGSHVTLISLHQAALIEFDYLIVAGMDSRHYPGTGKTSIVFNDAVRSDLGLQQRSEMKSLQRQRFISLLISARETVLTYQKKDQDEMYQPSLWWSQIDVFHRLAYDGASLEDHELAQLSFAPYTRPVPVDPLPRTIDPLKPPAPSAPSDLLPHEISASAHQSLINCPYQFFALRMLRLRKPSEIHEEMDAADFGSFVHQCLEVFYKGDAKISGTPWEGSIDSDSDQALQLLKDIGKGIIDQYSDNKFSHMIYLPRWEAVAHRFIKILKQTKGRRFVASEQEESLSIGPHLKLKGRIDRIDHEGEGQTIVVDYKTGRLIPPKHIQSGEQVQLSTYALLLPDTEGIEYWWLNNSSNRTVSGLWGEDLKKVQEKVSQRLQDNFERLNAGAGMPANGEDNICKHCDAQGICRKDSWAISESPLNEGVV